MKIDMRLAFRLLAPFGSIVGLISACSSTTDNQWKVPAPPGGSGSVIPQAGSDANGGGGTGGAAGGNGGASANGGAGGGASCNMTSECVGTGFICKNKACACPVDKPDVCGAGAEAACVTKMTDPDNCGTCGMKCEAGAACVAGKCGATPKAVTMGTASCGGIRMVLEGTTLYWTETGVGNVRSMPLAGGAVTTVATMQKSPTQIAADAKGIYWANQGTGTDGTTSTVMKLALPIGDGDKPVQLKAGSGMNKIVAITVFKDKLYYTLGNEVHAISTDEAVKTDEVVGIATNYDPMVPVAAGFPSGLAANDAKVVWTTENREGVEGDDPLPETGDLTDKTGYVELGQSQGSLLLSDIALDAKNAYWANGEGFYENALDAKDPVPTRIWSTPNFEHITSFVLVGDHVYAGETSGLIMKHDLTPPSDPNDETTIVPADIIARDQKATTSMITDGKNVIWATEACAILSTPL